MSFLLISAVQPRPTEPHSGPPGCRASAGGDNGITALFKFIVSKKKKGRLPESGIDSMPPESHVDADPESDFRFRSECLSHSMA